MKGILFVLACIIMAVSFYKTRLNYYQKMALKVVLAYFSVLAFGISFIMLIVTGINVGTVIKEDTLEERLQSAAWYTSNGDFDSLESYMEYHACYEEEFDHLWEQIDMYDRYNLYEIYTKAAEARKGTPEEEIYLTGADEQKQKLLEICESSTFSENELYAEYYGSIVWEE